MMDNYENFIILRDEDGNMYDHYGRRVNQRGYLIDN
jgi:hypothetical protein